MSNCCGFRKVDFSKLLRSIVVSKNDLASRFGNLEISHFEGESSGSPLGIGRADTLQMLCRRDDQ